jgi:glycosyltransferase involved in cell wall biosynthesis
VRIALVSTPFVAVPPRAYGGTELVIHELARGLGRAGHQVTLFATGDSDGRDVRWLYERPVWPPDHRAGRRHCRASAREIASEGFDLVHAHASSFVEFADALDVPVVHTMHHARDEALLGQYLEHPSVRYVAISGRQAALVPELECAVIHHGLDPASMTLGRGEGGYALFLGRLSWAKGPDLAVRAAREAGFELVVAGQAHAEPDDPPGWRRDLDRVLASPGVRRVGGVGGERKRRLLGGARALLMPIRWEEPFGLVQIEAMFCGTPVVALRRGAAPEIVEDGVTGFLVDDPAALAEALRRAAALDRDACRRRAIERFSTARMLRDHLRVYHAACAASSVPRRAPAAEGWSHAT